MTASTSIAAEEIVEMPPLLEMKSVEEEVVEAERMGIGRLLGERKRDGGWTKREEVGNSVNTLTG